MVRSLVVVLLLIVSFVLAGCTSGTEEPTTEETTGSGVQEEDRSRPSSSSAPAPTTATSTAPPTSSAPKPGNKPPTASIVADQNAGTAPLNVSFTLNGEDADGNALSWSLDADADGVADVDGTGDMFPYAYTFTYMAGGAYNATLQVTDGTETAFATLRIDITASVPAGDPIIVEGSTIRLAIFCEDSVHPISGVTGWHYLLEADAVLVAGPAYIVFDYDGELIAADDQVEGTVPPNVTGVKVCTPTEAQGQQISYKITFTPQ